jgi:multiple sugar transport system ATP-binding protein
MLGVTLRNIAKQFGTTPVLRGVSLAVEEGEFLAILGPSGCGKSTLLRIIAGLETADGGEVFIGDRQVDHLPAKARDLAMVFQSYALYPYMTVAENIALPLQMRRLSALQRLPFLGAILPGTRSLRQQVARDVNAVATPLGLEGLLGRKPAQLSGGQRQRVALARAMVRHPAAFLMDEPLSNLDARLRADARAEIISLTRRLGVTTLYVTHDQSEAMAMADRVAVMEGGILLQLAPPQALYDDPQNLAVARFVGSPPINIWPVEVTDRGDMTCCGHRLPFRARSSQGSAQLGLRPENLDIHRDGIPAQIVRLERLGMETLVHCHINGLAGTTILRLAPGAAEQLSGFESIRLLPKKAILFDLQGNRLPIIESARIDA